MQRKSAILLAANQHFAHYGFRGASLRDIARDAGVSLTLLNHHFGNKYQLLAAVIESYRPMLDERSTALIALMHGGPGTFTVGEMVREWVRIAFTTASEPDGEMFLRLVARVVDDASEEAVEVVRDKLDDAALVFIDGLQQCYPDATRYAAASAYLYVSATLLKFLVASKRLFRLAQAAPPVNARTQDQVRLTHFLVAGIEAAMQAEIDLVDGAVDGAMDGVADGAAESSIAGLAGTDGIHVRENVKIVDGAARKPWLD
jgi:AcrR family transcriptional regulator